MQLQVILNHVEHYKGFVYKRVRWDKTTSPWTLRVQVVPRANSHAECSGCRKKCAGYDRLPEREFEFVPLWGLAVFLVYAMRRVECPRCGICVEHVPWGDGKCRQTKSYRWFLARWAKRLPWLEVARIFHTSWDTVYRSVRHAVAWGLVHRDESGVEAIGIDEIQCQRGQRYLTLGTCLPPPGLTRTSPDQCPARFSCEMDGSCVELGGPVFQAKILEPAGR